MFDKLLTALHAWPLLLVGVVVLGAGVALAQADDDPSDARALLLGVGAVLVGAGIVRVAVDHRHHDHPTDRDGAP